MNINQSSVDIYLTLSLMLLSMYGEQAQILLNMTSKQEDLKGPFFSF